MLCHTFQHIPGLGERRERALWRRGISTWDDLLAPPAQRPAALLHDAQAIIHLSQEALRQGNIYFFAQLLPVREHWRLYGDFQDATAYLDIETGPLGLWPTGHHGHRPLRRAGVSSFVRGDNLHTFEFCDGMTCWSPMAKASICR